LFNTLSGLYAPNVQRFAPLSPLVAVLDYPKRKEEKENAPST